METYLYVTAVLGVYIALGVFIIGMGWRVYHWIASPRSRVTAGLFPKPRTRVGRYTKMLKDTMLAPQTARLEPSAWAFSFVFHIAALIGFLGHVRLVGEYPILPGLLGTDGMEKMSALVGGAAGTLMLVAVVFWIGRRTFGPFKRLSVPEDYLILALLFGIIAMGDHMRFSAGISTETFRTWFQSLLAFKPVIPNELLDPAVGWSLATHMLLVDALLIYFPFSKLVHVIGAFSTNLTRSE